MTQQWAAPTAPPVLGPSLGSVSLVEGAGFLICSRSGSILPTSPHGLFFMDTRFLSHLDLTINGAVVEPLDVIVEEPFVATFVGRPRPANGEADTQLTVSRRRTVHRGMHEELIVRNYGLDEVACVVTIEFDVDFADLFEVKESRVRRRGEFSQAYEDGFCRFAVQRGDARRQAAIHFDQPPLTGPQHTSWEVRVPPQGTWGVSWDLAVGTSDRTLGRVKPAERGAPRARLHQWRSRAPVVTSDHYALDQAAAQAVDDLGVLRIEDPEDPGYDVIAAGAPWFMTLFGRDSLLTGWMTLLVDPDLALGVLRTLARLQGTRVDERTEEQPGRILHEVRFGEAAELSLGGANVYYGSNDATQLFVMLLGELRRWGLADNEVRALLPHADRALAWVEEYGDRDGDGYVEYQRATEHGLLHQGWKDSWDGIRFADGRHPEHPIALCEVQAYTYAAFIARAHFAEQDGDVETAGRWLRKAQELKLRFNADFWIEERGWYAVGLDGDKQRIDSLTSNMGHCLWTGIVDEDKAPLVAKRLVSPELFSGWGVRTLGASMAAYNPVSYHCGSVWPHDTALAAAGLMRYGFVDEAHQLVLGLLDVARSAGGRLPELFCGFGKDELPAPVAYPTSCSPQAWAAAAPLSLVRTLLRLDPWAPHGAVWLAPALPEPIKRLRVAGIPLAGQRVTVTVEGDDVELEGLASGLELRREPRRPLTGLFEELSGRRPED